MISHRSSTLRFAEEILVLERGVCVARGSHRELLEMPGIYASLFGSDEVRDR
jgi:ABC-type transport system involved in Fe-S cluster assembly fused permease/ATPase subunit